jgi:glycerol kinase
VTVIVAIDAGTTSVRSLAVSPEGKVLAQSSREFAQHYPRPAWVEHDPDEIWAATVATLAEVVSADQQVAGVGITNQRETVVAWDRATGAALAPAIVWQDRRTTTRCEELVEQGHLEAIRNVTGLVADPYFSATKMEWLLQHAGVEASSSLAFGTVDSWLIHKLTGGAHVTETSNASRTMLFDLEAGAWSSDMCDLFGVPPTALAEIGPSSGELARTSADSPLGPGVPICGVAGDQQAALFGQACFARGSAKNTYGTGSFVLMNVGTTCPSPAEGLLTTVAWTIDGATTFALEGSIFATGAAVQWLRDELGIIEAAAELEPLAMSCDSADGVVLVPAFAGLGSPWWDPRARGTIVGITRGTGRPQLARATIEAMTYQTRDVVDAMTRAAGEPLSVLHVDGGASVMNSMLQLQADQLGTPVARPQVEETTALGAAHLAGLACGVWTDLDELAGLWAIDREFHPAPDADPDAGYQEWQRAVERSRAWA